MSLVQDSRVDLLECSAEQLFDIVPEFVINKVGQPKYLRVQKTENGAVVAKYGGHLYASAGTSMHSALKNLAESLVEDGYRFIDGKLIEVRGGNVW